MYKVSVYNSEGVLLEELAFVYRDDAKSVAEAFYNLTDYSVVIEEM